MLDKIPSYIVDIHKKFTDAGYAIYLVGGCVRDLLQNKTPKDWDMTTSATPEQILQLFPDGFYDNAFGTVGIPVKKLIETEHPGVVEITTFRTEKGYADRRHPETVEWGKTIEEDLSRRDFTMNAIALRLSQSVISNEVRDLEHNNEEISPASNAVRNDNSVSLEAVGFGMGKLAADIHKGDTIAVAYTIDENVWNGNTKLQLKLKDVSSE